MSKYIYVVSTSTPCCWRAIHSKINKPKVCSGPLFKSDRLNLKIQTGDKIKNLLQTRPHSLEYKTMGIYNVIVHHVGKCNGLIWRSFEFMQRRCIWWIRNHRRGSCMFSVLTIIMEKWKLKRLYTRQTMGTQMYKCERKFIHLSTQSIRKIN